MKWKVFFILSMVFLFACNKAQNNSTSYQTKDITPKGEHNLLIVESESCIYCKQLDRDLKSDEGLKASLQGMNIYKILYESNSKVKYKLEGTEGIKSEEELAKMLRVNSFPYLLFYNGRGNIVLSIPGYVEPKALACIVDYVKDEEYKKKKVQDYLRERQCV